MSYDYQTYGTMNDDIPVHMQSMTTIIPMPAVAAAMHPAAESSSGQISSTESTKDRNRKPSFSMLKRSRSAFFGGSTNRHASNAPRCVEQEFEQCTNRPKSKGRSIDDQSSYCLLAPDGMEVLDDNALLAQEDQQVEEPAQTKGKTVKKSPSLGNLLHLKTPSRLSLRKMPSKLRIFGSGGGSSADTTPAIVRSKASFDTSLSASTPGTSGAPVYYLMSPGSTEEKEPLPPLPAVLPPLPPLPPKDNPAIMSGVSSTTPTSTKSVKSTKSLFRTAFRSNGKAQAVDRGISSKSIASRPSSRPRSGTVKSQVSRIERLQKESANSGAPSVRTVGEQAPSIGKTPKQGWLNRLARGATGLASQSQTTKPALRLEIPDFEESPCLRRKVEIELEQRQERTTSQIVIDPPAEEEDVSQSYSYLPRLSPQCSQPERLSAIVQPTSTLSPSLLTPDQRHEHGSAFPFPIQSRNPLGLTVIASSPFSGDLHLPAGAADSSRLSGKISKSPARLALERSTNSRRSFIAEIGLEEGRERPKSEPLPLKGVAGATVELQNLLDTFEDTFYYENPSYRPSLASTTFQNSTTPATCVTAVSEAQTSGTADGSDGSDVPDDLQDLIDGVTSSHLGDDMTTHSAVSAVSSFEGNASTAHAALAMSSGFPFPFMPRSSDYGLQVPYIAQTEQLLRSSIDETERPSLDTERPSLDSTRSSEFGPDSARSSFDYGSERKVGLSYYGHTRTQHSTGGHSNRSSLRDYITMERPTIGDRMLDEIDEDVPLAPIGNPLLRQSYYSDYSAPRSSRSPHLHNRMAGSSNLTTASSCDSESMLGHAIPGLAVPHSPTPINLSDGHLRSISHMNRHSIEPQVGGDSGRPSIDSDHESRPSIDSLRPSPPLITVRQDFLQRQQKQKHSTASSMMSFASTNSSPCPRPPRRKLLMLTGNRLPRAPLKQPVFSGEDASSVSVNGNRPRQSLLSPEAGRVRRLKDSWEAKISPKKDDKLTMSGSSPRYVRPLPATLGKMEIARPRPLSSLSLNGAMIPPDTPPPSSPSASEQSFSSGSCARTSMDSERPSSRFMQAWNRNRGHCRQTSALSRHSVLAERIDEEPTTTYAEQEDSAPEVTLHAGPEPNLQEEAGFESPSKPFSPLIIRKRSDASIRASGLGAFNAYKTLPAVRRAERQAEPVVEIVESDKDWEALHDEKRLHWARFCQEAAAELQKSRALWPDTDVSLEMMDSPSSGFNSVLSSPRTPILTSPLHRSAVVSFLLDSQSRYRSHLGTHDSSHHPSSPDVPATPGLSPDDSGDSSYIMRSYDDTPPSPSPAPVPVRQSAAYKPRSLVLVQKHLSQQLQPPQVQPVQQNNVLRDATNTLTAVAVMPKSTKGFKPRAANTATSTLADIASVRKPMSPVKKLRIVAKNRTVSVYADALTGSPLGLATREQMHSQALTQTQGQGRGARGGANSFLGSKQLSTRRKDAFAAARRKLEGLGGPDEQTDRSSGTSSNDESSSGSGSGSGGDGFSKTKVLEAGGVLEAYDTSRISISRPRPARPGARKAQSSTVKLMR